MSRDHDPLTPEERALADAMARAAGPRRGPSPQVDAAILSSARAALAREAASPVRRRRRRWPAALGVAASLVFAVGIAWQLRPVPDQELPAVTEGPPPAAPVAADRAAPAEAQRYQSPADVPAPETAPPPGPPIPAPEPAQAKPTASPTRQASPQPRELARPQPEAAREAMAAPPPPAPPAPPAPAAAAAAETQASTAESAAETAIGRSRVTQKAATRPVRTLGMPTTVATPVLDAASDEEATDDDGGIVFDRHALHDVPPATVDSPGIHRAWLDRIRELREAGELEAARESLREYRRRYPDQPLPDDLDGLLDE